jgi:biotin transporter BioY
MKNKTAILIIGFGLIFLLGFSVLGYFISLAIRNPIMWIVYIAIAIPVILSLTDKQNRDL